MLIFYLIYFLKPVYSTKSLEKKHFKTYDLSYHKKLPQTSMIYYEYLKFIYMTVTS